MVIIRVLTNKCTFMYMYMYVQNTVHFLRQIVGYGAGGGDTMGWADDERGT